MRPTRPSRRLLALAAAATAAALAGPAGASIMAAANAERPALRVDARGNAEVSWTEGGTRRTLLIPPQGRYLPGGKLAGPDVSRPATVPGLPFTRVVRRTPDGRLWALQAWSVQPGGPVELRFSRWTGDPTVVEAQVAGARLSGSASFAGRPVYGFSPTTAGTPIRHYAFVDCRGCPGAPAWKRLQGVTLAAPGGTFRLALTPQRKGSEYRVTVAGPNRGWTYAPDATVVVQAP